MNPNGHVANLTPFEPGTSGNPGGKPAGARNRLQGDFLHALADDFAEHGRDAIKRCREASPAAYLRIIASLMPREIDARDVLDELTDDELRAALEIVQGMMRRD